MENLPDIVLEKIQDYVIDLFRKDHVKKFKITLTSLRRIYYLYIENRWDFSETNRKWKIRHANGVYRILRYSGNGIASHWLNISVDIIDGIRPTEFGSEWYTMLGVF